MSLGDSSKKLFFLKEENKIHENDPLYLIHLCSQNRREKINEYLEKNKSLDFTALIDKKEYTCLYKSHKKKKKTIVNLKFYFTNFFF